MKYDFNVLEKRARELINANRPSDAIKIYLFMADGDRSLDAGYLAMRLAECYEQVGDYMPQSIGADEPSRKTRHYIIVLKRVSDLKGSISTNWSEQMTDSDASGLPRTNAKSHRIDFAQGLIDCALCILDS